MVGFIIGHRRKLSINDLAFQMLHEMFQCGQDQGVATLHQAHVHQALCALHQTRWQVDRRANSLNRFEGLHHHLNHLQKVMDKLILLDDSTIVFLI